MTQSNLEELNQTIVDLQAQLDAAKVLLRKVTEGYAVQSADAECEFVAIKSDVMATIRAVVAEG